MAHETAAWMPLYVADYLSDTGHLSAAEHGAYILMLMHYWRTANALPAHDDQLRRIARMSEKEWDASRTTLMAFFEQLDDGWHHRRVEEELASARERSEKARGSANKRWDKERGKKPRRRSARTADAMPPQSEGNANASPEQCSSPSPSSSNEEDTAFEKFYSAYPLKKKPGAVRKALRAALKKTDLQTILRGVDRYKAEDPDRPPKFTAHPASWLNDERWLDVSHDQSTYAKKSAPVGFAPGFDPWNHRVAGFTKNGFWLDSWGPKPGELDCEAPKKLVDEALLNIAPQFQRGAA